LGLDPVEAPAALTRWIGWARRCRIPAFVALQRRIVKHQASILAAIEHGLSNGRIESVNTKIRLLTRIAFGSVSLEHFAERLKLRAADDGTVEVVTRYLPKRHAEIAGAAGGNGSLYWIIKHQLVARTPILGFGEAPDGKCAIRIDPNLVLLQARGKRAHQGWRYLEHDAAPADLGGGATEGLSAMPAARQGELAELALI
jgi:hypothetical protein